MTGFLRWAWSRAPLAADEDVLTRMIAVGRACLGSDDSGGCGRSVDRLALASVGLQQFPRTAPRPEMPAGLIATALDLPPQAFCLACTTSERAGTEALRVLGNGLVMAADGELAAAILLVDNAPPRATVLAVQSALAAYPGLGEGAPDYEQEAYLALVQEAAEGLRADRLVLNPPHPRLAKPAAQILGFAGAATANGGAAGPLVGLLEALDQAAPGQTVLLVSYGHGSAADALLVRKEGG